MANPATLTLFVPGLLLQFSERNAPTCPSLPTLARALSRARRAPFPTAGKDPCLLQLFHCDSASPIAAAALARLADGVTNADSDASSCYPDGHADTNFYSNTNDYSHTKANIYSYSNSHCRTG